MLACPCKQAFSKALSWQDERVALKLKQRRLAERTPVKQTTFKTNLNTFPYRCTNFSWVSFCFLFHRKIAHKLLAMIWTHVKNDSLGIIALVSWSFQIWIGTKFFTLRFSLRLPLTETKRRNPETPWNISLRCRLKVAAFKRTFSGYVFINTKTAMMLKVWNNPKSQKPAKDVKLRSLILPEGVTPLQATLVYVPSKGARFCDFRSRIGWPSSRRFLKREDVTCKFKSGCDYQSARSTVVKTVFPSLGLKSGLDRKEST